MDGNLGKTGRQTVRMRVNKTGRVTGNDAGGHTENDWQQGQNCRKGRRN